MTSQVSVQPEAVLGVLTTHFDVPAGTAADAAAPVSKKTAHS